MTALYALSALLAATAGTGAVDSDAIEQRDVAYEELQGGEARLAIERLEAVLEQNPDDPALLINLGSAHAEAGNLEMAETYYQAAVDSDIRYRLELADGDWIDSRRAARMALRSLEERNLALR